MIKILTAAQILDIVENNMEVSQFGYGDYPVPLDFVGSDELEKAKQLKDQAWQNVENHPTNDKSWDEKKNDVEYQALLDTYREMPSYHDKRKEEWLMLLGLGKVVEVEQYGGEGQGDTWYSVKHFVDHDVYIQTDGYYSSYNGTDFEEGYGFEVKPEEVMVIQYKAV